MQTTMLYFALFVSLVLEQASASGCFKQSADIVFAVDSSFSIRSHDFHRQLSFLRALIDRFTIGQNQIQVGVVSFGSSVHVDIKLNDFNNKRDLKIAVGNIKHLEGGTLTYEAIKFIHTHMYEPEYGGRPWAKRQLVLITDGLSNNSSATLLEASVARSKGIEVFSIGVGEGFEDLEIRGVASDPEAQHVFRVENYKALMGIENAMSSAACHQPGDIEHVQGGDDHEYEEFPTAPSACERNAAEVVFLMDSSSSIWGPDFQRQIKFIQQVTSSFDISDDATRVGVVAYSDAPITLVSLTDKQSHDHIHHALATAPYITGGTNTALAINHARKIVLANGVARPNVAHVIIILSDGQSDDMGDTITEASHAHEDGVQIFAIGIGNKTIATELMAIASDPDDRFVFHVDDYEALSEIKELLAIKTCDVAADLMQGDAPAMCPPSPTDLVFIYDTKALSRHHHNYVINIISDVTESRRLNAEDLRVGVFREASLETNSLLHDIELTDQWTESNFKSKLDPDSRTASIDLLLRRVRHKYFHPTLFFDSTSHKRTIVIFLDSALENSFGSTIEAIRLRRADVRIIAVTLGKHYNKWEVLSLVTSPHDHHIIDSPSTQEHHKRDVVSKLLSLLCEPRQ